MVNPVDGPMLVAVVREDVQTAGEVGIIGVCLLSRQATQSVEDDVCLTRLVKDSSVKHADVLESSDDALVGIRASSGVDDVTFLGQPEDGLVVCEDDRR